MEVERGSTDRAANLYRRALSKDPFSKARYEYAQLLTELGMVRDARRELRDVLAADPTHRPSQLLLSELEKPAR